MFMHKFSLSVIERTDHQYLYRQQRFETVIFSLTKCLVQLNHQEFSDTTYDLRTVIDALNIKDGQEHIQNNYFSVRLTCFDFEFK